jgi:AmiR/NasT family two-component response regulator
MRKDSRVLIVEDEPVIAEMIQGMLEDMGYSVAGKAVNGLQAVEMAPSIRPDVILMDLQMPDMDGIEASRRIQECCPTPIVVLTAHETTNWVERASAVGVGAYLLKPPNAQEMKRGITIAIARFNDLMELRRLNKKLQKALTKISTLSGLLPICTNCKKIRDDEGYWQQIEVYIRDHSEAEFSHSLCPGCAKELYPEVYQKLDQPRQDILNALTEFGWANLEDISATVGLPESSTLNRLQMMIRDGQVKYLDVDGEAFYKLP